MRLFIYIPIRLDQIWTFNLVYIYAGLFAQRITCFPFLAYVLSYILYLVSLTYTYMTYTSTPHSSGSLSVSVVASNDAPVLHFANDAIYSTHLVTEDLLFAQVGVICPYANMSCHRIT
jgi:hypothetical protein